MLRLRRSQRALHPRAAQRVLDCGSDFFVIARKDPVTGHALLAVHNLTASRLHLSLGDHTLGAHHEEWYDLIGKRYVDAQEPGGALELDLAPYQVLWLIPAA